MDLSDVLAGLALLVSIGALVYSKKADNRAGAAEERAIEEHRRQEVFFVAEYEEEHGGTYKFRLINKGTKKADFPKVAPESVQRFAVLTTVWGLATPHDPLIFRYEKPLRGQMESLTLRWSGAGAGEQVVAIPPHRQDGN